MKKTMPHDLRDIFQQFARNGRWGTCVDCPKDADGYTYPEACVNTARGDHRLGFDWLVAMYRDRFPE